MTASIRRLLRLRKDEQRSALSAFVVLFHMIAGHTILETARDALFLERMPPSRLTTMYVALAGLTLVTSSQITRFARNFGARNALIATLVVGAWAATILHFQAQSAWRVTALYLFTGVLAGILVAQFWLVMGRMFTVTQGRRVFGPVAAGGVLGAAFGSSLATGLLMLMPVDKLLLAGAGAFVFAALLLTILPEDREESLPGTNEGAPTPTLATATPAEKRFVWRVVAFVVLATSTSLAADYLFKSTAAALVPKAELGAFFARSYAALNILALVVQLLFASRLLARLGVTGAVVLTPVLLVLASSGATIVGAGIGTALAMKGVDGSLKHSLHRVATELLYLPLPPHVRDRAHVLIDTVISRLAQAGAAAIVFALVALNVASPTVIAVLGLGFALAWTVSARLLRRPYLDLFRDAIARGTFDDAATEVDLDVASIERVIDALSSRDAPQAVAALGLLNQKGRARLVPTLILYHESAEVLRAALPVVAQNPNVDAWAPLAERLVAHADEGVRIEAVRALARAGRHDVVERTTRDASLVVRTFALHAMVSHEATAPADHPRIRELLDDETPTGDEARRTLLRAVAEGDSERWTTVVLSMIARSKVEHGALPVEFVRAAAALRDGRFIGFLIARLGTRDGRALVREALASLNEPALDALEEALWERDTDRNVRLHIPRTMSRFKSPRVQAMLLRILEESTDGHVRYKALRGLGRHTSDEQRLRVDRVRIVVLMRKNLLEHFRLLGLLFALRARLGAAPRLDEAAAASLTLLIELIDSKVQQALERAFRLLQIAHPRERIDRAYSALTSLDRRVRASAVEFIDALTLRRGEEEIRDLLRRAIDDPTQSVLAQSSVTGIAFPTGYQEAVSLLLADPDETLAMLATHHASLMGSPFRDAVAATLKTRPTLEEAVSRLFGWPGVPNAV
ncbi:MAG: HEAT repeat domain-containing protein [Myxococcales bacterium]|nr:HEAT repeat domain-containing protein [Myxococcales bacterium]